MAKRRWKVKQLKVLLLRHENGETLQEIGLSQGVSSPRIREVFLRYIPKSYRKFLKRQKKKRLQKLRWKRNSRNRRILEVYGRKSYTRLSRIERRRGIIFSNKKKNVRTQTKWNWSINLGDIKEWPTHCPLLGVPLKYFSRKRSDNSPSFDRINPKKGYVKGNVWIISWRANRIKNDATVKELLLIAKNLKQLF